MLLALPEVGAHNILKPLWGRLHLLPDGPVHCLLPACGNPLLTNIPREQMTVTYSVLDCRMQT